MAAIIEDYVSFETAKLLKEKGFDEYCRASYNLENGELSQFLCHCCGDNRTQAPTLQMAMKWLRENHNLSVEVYRTACGYVGCIVSIPSGTDIEFLEETGDDLSSGQYTKWEYACDASIKYCLEHWIHLAQKSK